MFGTDRGSVTAEMALALPVLMLVLTLCLNALAALGARIALQDQVADAARSYSRGQHIDARFTVTETGDLVCVSTSRGVGVLAISADACALANGG